MASSSSIPEEEGGLIQNGVNFVDVLPEGCLAMIISLITPVDACSLALVSKDMLSASELDVVWERFLPSDCDLIVSRSDGGEALLAEFQSRKQLYKRLVTQPLLVDQSSKSFWMERLSGKKCWMIAARSLRIAWGDTPRYWIWTRIDGSRFPEAAVLECVYWFDVGARIETALLSPGTQYSAYLVFSRTEIARGFQYAFKASVSTGGAGGIITEHVYLEITRVGRRGGGRRPVMRGDGWWEVMIGEFFSNHPGEGDDEVELSVREVENLYYKTGIIVEGIELRPASVA